ncbi:MAG: hypothetical protein LLF94_07505 [Chlamydiales bacterium]|nr:hypothetical protein [Chlamydiales bacterium]
MKINNVLFLILSMFSFSQLRADQASITAKIQYVHEFNDFDRGCIFTLTDKSKWARDWYNGPAYYPAAGQTVTLIPMSESEALENAHPLYKNPHWLSIHPAPGMAAITIVYVAYKLSN